MRLLAKLLVMSITTGLTCHAAASDIPKPASITNSAHPTSYSLDPGALSSMERQVRSMLKQRIIQTPAINPATALPPIVLKAKEDDASGDSQTLSRQKFYSRLITAAKDRTKHQVKYDGSYRYIRYPMGDVAANRGVCTDVIIRSYRQLGIDLQQLVHEDIRENFQLYPSRARWGNREPDSNIDHRRVYNLQVFFQRYGKSLPITNKPADYLPGDLVTWTLGPKMPHIGVVVDEYSSDNPEHPLIVHNIGHGPKQEDILFTFPITGHYRYQPGRKSPRSVPPASPAFPSPTPSGLLVQKRKKPSSNRNSLVEAAFFLLH